MFQRLEPEQSSASAANAAVEALLEADSDCDERLSKVEFHRLLSRLCTTAGLTTEQGAQRLLDSLRGNSSGGMGGAMAAADAVKTVSQDGDILGLRSASQNAVPVEHARLLALFQAWDSAGDGRICFNELCQGLAKLNRAAGQVGRIAHSAACMQNAAECAAHSSQCAFAEITTKSTSSGWCCLSAGYCRASTQRRKRAGCARCAVWVCAGCCCCSGRRAVRAATRASWRQHRAGTCCLSQACWWQSPCPTAVLPLQVMIPLLPLHSCATMPGPVITCHHLLGCACCLRRQGRGPHARPAGV